MQKNKQQSDGGSYVTVIKKFMSIIIIGGKENGMAGKDINNKTNKKTGISSEVAIKCLQR